MSGEPLGMSQGHRGHRGGGTLGAGQQNFLKDFFRNILGGILGEPWEKFGETLGAGQQDFLKDFFKDVQGTLGDIDVPGDIVDIDLGNRGGWTISTAFPSSKNPLVSSA